MKTNSRWSFVCEGLKQASLVVGACLLVGGIGWISLYTRIIHNDIFGSLVGMTIAFGAGILIGPVPTLLTFFDISDKQLFVLSCVLIIPYWVCLGAIAGFLQQPKQNPDANQQQNLSAKQIKKKIRWTIEILAVVFAVFLSPLSPWRPFGTGFISGGRYSAGAYRNALINNLRQIDAARNQFILEKSPSTNYIVTEADLKPYIKLNSKGEMPHLGSERYIWNPMDKPVYAILDSDWRMPRHGWREGFTFTNGTVFRLP